MRSKSFSRFFRDRSEVSVTTSLIPVVFVSKLICIQAKTKPRALTWILGVFWANIIVARVEDILVHQCGAWSDLSEEGNLDGLANLHFLALLDEYLACEFAAVLAIEGWHAVCLGMVSFLEGLERSHEVMATGNTVGDDLLRDTGCHGSLDDGGNRVHGPDHLGLELRWHMQFDLLEEILGRAKPTDHQDVLQSAVLSLDGNDLVPHELQDAVNNRLEALQNLLISESHVAFLDTSLGEFRLDTDIDRPFLSVVPEIGLDSVLEVHDALGIDTTGRLGSVGQLHLSDLCAENVAEISVEGCRTARITRASRAFGHCERVLVFDFVRNQIDGTSTTIDDEHRIVDLEVKKASLGAEKSSSLGLADKGQPIVVLVTEEARLDGCGSGGCLSGIVPDGRYC